MLIQQLKAANQNHTLDWNHCKSSKAALRFVVNVDNTTESSELNADCKEGSVLFYLIKGYVVCGKPVTKANILQPQIY